jgi:hypothetical protein
MNGIIPCTIHTSCPDYNQKNCEVIGRDYKICPNFDSSKEKTVSDSEVQCKNAAIGTPYECQKRKVRGDICRNCDGFLECGILVNKLNLEEMPAQT